MGPTFFKCFSFLKFIICYWSSAAFWAVPLTECFCTVCAHVLINMWSLCSCTNFTNLHFCAICSMYRVAQKFRHWSVTVGKKWSVYGSFSSSDCRLFYKVSADYHDERSFIISAYLTKLPAGVYFGLLMHNDLWPDLVYLCHAAVCMPSCLCFGHVFSSLFSRAAKIMKITKKK